MKRLAIATYAATFAVALFPAFAVGTAKAEAPANKSPAVSTSANYVSGVKPRNVCLRSYRIDHTTYKREDNSLLFHMRNGTIWKNHLRSPCYGLAFHGFAYENYTDQICGNFQSIRVLHSGEVCMLGSFTPYAKPKLEKAALN